MGLKLFWRMTIGALALLAAAGGLQGATIIGPVLTSTESGHSSHGIIFDALQDATLTGFQFSNQGQADNVTLWDNTSSLQVGSVAVGAGNPVISFNVNWGLTLGHTYFLLGHTTNNGMFTYASFPVSNIDIEVTSGYFSSPYPTAWGDFNNIETNGGGAVVPEPGTLATLGLGLALLALRSRRK
jgi:hypothetical protein